MPTNKKISESMDFVTAHYRPDSFSADRDWKQLGLANGRRFSFRIAASVAVFIALTVSAGVALWLDKREAVPTEHFVEEAVSDDVRPSADDIVKIEFVNAPLDRVIDKIEESYGVVVGNVPTENYSLTLSYEGTAHDLIETINELLGTRMTLE